MGKSEERELTRIEYPAKANPDQSAPSDTQVPRRKKGLHNRGLRTAVTRIGIRYCFKERDRRGRSSNNASTASPRVTEPPLIPSFKCF
ncbi:hypothetical protein CEXT_87201 [Caerostris extrusa]|uniref:Uncharacterized protein n=1 Tax=Caerostris extrusa TaxID=172846 RepID=A0AAV4T650_CAEEX|nr:hypothetical protein CEXT_87201 [Caerostris extrusa]